MMASYLLGMQTRRRKELSLEKAAEAQDSGHGVSDDDDEMVSDGGGEVDGDDSDFGNMMPPIKCKRNVHPRRIMDSDDDSEAEEDQVSAQCKNHKEREKRNLKSFGRTPVIYKEGEEGDVTQGSWLFERGKKAVLRFPETILKPGLAQDPPHWDKIYT
jgi:hypothetical protein